MMMRFFTGMLVFAGAVLLAVVAPACNVGGDEPWEGDDGPGGDSDSDSDADADTEQEYDLLGDDCYESTTVVVPGTYSGDTQTMTDDYAGSCGGAGPDLVVMFEMAQAGTFTADFAASEIPEPVLYLREVCTDEGTELLCEIGIQSQPPSLSVGLEDGFYFLFVDGSSASDDGSFTIELGAE
jgi:hypothetical protein